MGISSFQPKLISFSGVLRKSLLRENRLVFPIGIPYTPHRAYKKSGFLWKLSASSFHHRAQRLSSQFLRCVFGPESGWQIGSDLKANRPTKWNQKPGGKAKAKLQTESFYYGSAYVATHSGANCGTSALDFDVRFKPWFDGPSGL